jgi:hypothetical protein
MLAPVLMWTIATVDQQRPRPSPSTPFPLSEVLLERAMRLNTDGKGAVLGKSMGIEIGGAHDGRNST